MHVETECLAISTRDADANPARVRYIHNVSPFKSQVCEMHHDPKLSGLFQKIGDLSSFEQGLLERTVDHLLAMQKIGNSRV